MELTPSPNENDDNSQKGTPSFEEFTPSFEENLEMFFAYPGARYPYPVGSGYRKAIMGMFYSSEHQLLAIASYGFLELEKLEKKRPMKKHPSTSQGNDVNPEPEFRIYTKFIDKAQTRRDLGNFWKSVMLNVKKVCNNHRNIKN